MNLISKVIRPDLRKGKIKKDKERKKQDTKDKNKIIKFSRKDREILYALEPIVEGIAKLFGSSCEIVLHSLEDLRCSIIKIENGYITGRKIGSPLTNLGIKILEDANSLKNNVTKSYYTKTKDGKILKSITTLIRNDKGESIGFLCINVNLSVPLVDLLNDFLPYEGITIKTTEHFVSNTHELIDSALDEAISKTNKDKRIPNSEKNKLIVFKLYNKEIFKIKGAVDIIAQKIGVSRYTIYNYVREAKVKLSQNKKETQL